MQNQRLHVSVSDFIDLVNQTLDYAYPLVDIEGEVANFKVNQGKYIFFDLKDGDATVNCFMSLFQLRQPIEDGMRIIVTASPKVTQWGRFSVTVKQMRLVGEGSIKKSFELLRAKLEKEGIFAIERKRPLPAMPHRIAVISSTQAAGYADFIKIVNERWGGLTIDVAHVQVQGVDAPDHIMKALSHINEAEDPYDVVVIIRGGGSADDLAAFNDELLTRAVAASRTPVLVGIGHETDEHLVDLAADVAAATPSNAAQLVVPDRENVIATAQRDIRDAARVLNDRADDMMEESQTLLAGGLDNIQRLVDERQSAVAQLVRVLSHSDPVAVLRRGYAIIRGEAVAGELIEIEQLKNMITAEVKYVKSKR